MASRIVQVSIENNIFQAVLARSGQEGKTISGVINDFLVKYADGAALDSPSTYTIQRGDTLGRIAKKFYGDARKYPIIQEANNIKDPGRIWIGQVLIIPGVKKSEPEKDTTSQPILRKPIQITPSKPSSILTPAPPPPPPSGVTPSPKPPIPSRTPQFSKPEVESFPSPNYNQRKSPDDITGITIHATASGTLEGVISWFGSSNSRVSAHYTIGKDGRVVQHVKDEDRAWHAGKSIWKGRYSCNDYCIGIELVNWNNGRDPYPEEQHQKNIALCAYLCSKYNISPDDIMAHYDIAIPKGRKTDPRGYDMDRLRREVAALLR